MTINTRRAHRMRRLAIGAAGALLLAVLATSAAEAAPRQIRSCPESFPVSDITSGMRARGLTVDRGTVPERFRAEALGVLNDGIAPGIDMILMELDSEALQDAGGVWSGMSGSPVYARDGRLIGAVSYVLADSASYVAGVTPAADMLELLDRSASMMEPADEVELSKELQDALVESGSATRAEAAAGLKPLALPVAVSGVGPLRLDDVFAELEDLLPGANFYSAGSAPIDPPGSPDEIVPGSNFTAAISYGDITIAGIGSTTAVCDVGGQDVALAFGHPMLFDGVTSLSAHSASALFIQPNIFGPIKIANPGGVVGTVDQDRMAGLRSMLGLGPVAIPVESTIVSVEDGTSRTGATHVNLQEHLNDVTYNHLVANIDRVSDRFGEGTSQLQWSITGIRASGDPFTVELSNAYASRYDIGGGTGGDLTEAIYAIDNNDFEEVTITSVDMTGSVSSGYNRYTFDEVLLRQPDGSYAPAPTGGLVFPVEAGSELEMRVVLEPYRSAEVVNFDFSLDIPADAGGQLGYVDVIGGAGGTEVDAPESLDDVLDLYNNLAPNNAVTAKLDLWVTPESPDSSTREVADHVVDGLSSFVVGILTP